MRFLLTERLARAFTLTADLVDQLDAAALRLDLPQLPSNRISGQLWCVVGARESYLTALETGDWQGFACSLQTPEDKGAVQAALRATADRLARLDIEALSDRQVAFGFDLLEHEIQHHGQLIRYVYANGLSFPESWHRRYTV